MTFILGTSRLTYDYFGDWNRRLTIAASSVPVRGDPSTPGECVPGVFMPGEELQEFRINAEVV